MAAQHRSRLREGHDRWELPDTSRELYRHRYEDKVIGPVPEVMVGVDYGDEKDTYVFGLFAVERSTGVITLLDTWVRPVQREGL